MAERRMFAKTIIDSDAFLDMPLSSQALYFHLSMRADDDGFLNNPLKVLRMIGCNKNDMDLLIGKRYILTFDSGIIVIKHWKMHNYIQKDRYKPTVYQEERQMLDYKKNGSYTIKKDIVEVIETECIQDGYSLETQVRLGKDRLGKVNKKEELAKAQTYFSDEALNNVFLDFIKMRKSLKNGAMTDRAITMMVNKLNKVDVNTAIKMLEQSILNNWKDIYELKADKPKKSNKFNNFEQRNYDYDDLEKKLQSKQNGGN